MARRGNIPGWARRAGAAAVAVILVLAALEAGLHLWFFGFSPRPAVFVPDTAPALYHPLVYRLESGVSYTTSYLNPGQRHWPHSFSVNRRGRRGEPLGPDGTAPRVAVLGDSFTFGVGVNDGAVWPAVLERILGGRADVANLGVPGYNTPQEVEAFLRAAPELSPRVVILAYGVRDWDENLYAGPWDVRLSRWSLTWSMARFWALSRARREPAAGMPGVFRAVERLDAACRGAGAKLFVFALYPDETRNALGRFCAERGIACRDLSGPYWERRLYIPEDMHPTAEAHFLYAAQAAHVLLSSGVLPDAAAGMERLSQVLAAAGEQEAARQVARQGRAMGGGGPTGGRAVPPGP